MPFISVLPRSLHPDLGVPPGHIVRHTAYGWVVMPSDFDPASITPESMDCDTRLRFVPYYEVALAEEAAHERQMMRQAAAWFDAHTTHTEVVPKWGGVRWTIKSDRLKLSPAWDPFLGVISFDGSEVPNRDRDVLIEADLPTYASILWQVGLDDNEMLGFVYL